MVVGRDFGLSRRIAAPDEPLGGSMRYLATACGDWSPMIKRDARHATQVAEWAACAHFGASADRKTVAPELFTEPPCFQIANR